MLTSVTDSNLSEFLPWIFIPLRHRCVASLPRMVRPLLYVLPFSILVFPLYLSREGLFVLNWPLAYGIHIAALLLYLGILIVEAYLNGPYRDFWKLAATSHCDDEKPYVTDILRKGINLANTTMVIWTVVLVATLLINSRLLKYLRVPDGFSDPLLYAMALAVVLFGLVTGAGLGLSVCMIYGIFLVAKHELIAFTPLHPDKAGGYSCFGRYSFRTVACLSLGVLFLPTLIEFAQLGEGIPAIVVMLVMVLYTLTLFFAFTVPLVFAYHSAVNSLTRIIGEYSDTYEEQITACIASPSEDVMFRIQALESILEKLGSINPYPFQISTLFKMIATSLLPILVFVIQMVLSSEYFSSLMNQSMQQWFSL